MNRISSLLISALAVVSQMIASTPGIPPGTKVSVRTSQTIDSSNASPGHAFSGVVAAHVMDHKHRPIIPMGAPVELVVRNVSKNEVTLDLRAITIGGYRYAVHS